MNYYIEDQKVWGKPGHLHALGFVFSVHPLNMCGSSCIIPVSGCDYAFVAFEMKRLLP